MAKLSGRKIKKFFADADRAETNAQKGKRLEDLACYLFEAVPGISVTARNSKNNYET